MEHRFENWLLVSDVDGTLAWGQQIPERNRQALRQFVEEGGRFTLATGRGFCALRALMKDLPVNAPVITLNGVTLVQPETGEALDTVPLSPAAIPLTRTIMARHPETGVFVVDDSRYYIARRPDFPDPLVEDRLRTFEADGTYVMYPLPMIPRPWHKVIFVHPPEKLEELQQEIRELCPPEMYIVRTDVSYLELVPTGINKGTALTRVAQMLDIPLERTVAVGDQENDRELLEAAGLAAAPSGAAPCILELADFVAGPCDQGAVADVIEELARRV